MSTPTERVQEYLRQFKKLRDTGGIIHNVSTDPDADGASLTVADLEEVLELVVPTHNQCEVCGGNYHMVNCTPDPKHAGYSICYNHDGRQFEL